MPNVLLTQKCVRSCPYCFAKKHMSGSPPDDILSWEDLIYIADLTESSGERRISLLGGEPSLHPEFVNFIIYLLERNFTVTAFTSGIMSESLLEVISSAFASVPLEKLNFVCNINDPLYSPKKEVEKVTRFLEIMGPRVCPGFNIYHPEFDLDFLLQYINTYGLKRSVRLGMTHPIPGVDNSFIGPEQMDDIIKRLMSFMPIFDRLRVVMGPDCGFPMCKFTDEQIGWLYKMTNGMFRFGCGPAIDIGPDMSVWSCFPLSSFHKKSVYEFDSLHDINRFYEERLHQIRIEVGGIYEECDDCRYRIEGICSGGCAAHSLSAFRKEAKVRLPEIYS